MGLQKEGSLQEASCQPAVAASFPYTEPFANLLSLRVSSVCKLNLGITCIKFGVPDTET